MIPQFLYVLNFDKVLEEILFNAVSLWSIIRVKYIHLIKKINKLASLRKFMSNFSEMFSLIHV